MATLEVTLPRLHKRQREVAEHPARFRVLAAGRRFGKTRLGSALCIATGVTGGRAWWVAPSYPVASVGWRQIKRLAVQVPGVTVREGERLIEFMGGGSVQVRSADNPDSLRGEGLDFAVLDECAFIKEDAWREALRPALSDRQGRAMFISTPKGRNWFWRAFMRGREDGGEWEAWRLPTADNPYIPAAEIEAARAMLPERIFQQEYMAEFLEDGGGVFRRVQEAATLAPLPRAEAGAQYVGGIDWGRSNDYTVLSVIDVTNRRQVALDRFSQTDYELQMSRFRAMHERFGVTSWIAEYNSMGGPMVERMQREGYPVRAFTTTNATKGVAIDALALALERGELGLLADEVQTAELLAYEAETLPSGATRYSAPEGMHDDTVMALALAWHGANRPPAPTIPTSRSARRLTI